MVYAIDKAKNTHLFVQRIYPDVKHWNSVLPKLETFWRICILPEILGRWYTRRCTVTPTLPSKDAICFCPTERDEGSILCSNKDCPYQRFHSSCLSLSHLHCNAKDLVLPSLLQTVSVQEEREYQKIPKTYCCVREHLYLQGKAYPYRQVS